MARMHVTIRVAPGVKKDVLALLRTKIPRVTGVKVEKETKEVVVIKFNFEGSVDGLGRLIPFDQPQTH